MSFRDVDDLKTENDILCIICFSAEKSGHPSFFNNQERFCLASQIHATFTNIVFDILHSTIRTRNSI